MLRRIRRHARLALACVLVATPVGAQTGRFDLEQTKAVLTETIERVIKERGVPSISIALVRGDSIVWTAAFGHANVRTRTPATPETIYSTGSTFKSATAVALMQLHEQGSYKLDDPVNRYLGRTQIKDKKAKPVTFRHILSHWSGLNPGATVKPNWGRELPKTLEEMVSGLHAVRAPEEKYEYNNFAYGMAGLLVERLSGKSYSDYMREQLFKPLGMATPDPITPSPEMVEVMALPYARTGNEGPFRPVAQVHFDVYPAGDVYLTPADMARFLGALLNGGTFQGRRILSAASVRAMQQPQFGGEYGFGLGVKKDPANGHTIISHGGSIPGQSAYLIGDVDARVGAYFMSNSGAPTAIGDIALRLLRGEAYPPVTGAQTKFAVKGQPVTLTFVAEGASVSHAIVETPRYKRNAKRRL